MDLGSDAIRDLLCEDEDSDLSDFGGDDTDDDPDFVLEESQVSDEEVADENAVPEPIQQIPDPEANRDQGDRQSGGPRLLNVSLPLQRVRNVASRIGKNGHLWSVVEPERRGRPQARNLVIHLPGAKGQARNVSRPLESWNLLIDNVILSEITLRTNEQIVRANQKTQNKQSYHGNTSENELLAFIGLLYLSGVQKNCHRNLEELWSVTFGSSIYRATMSLNRFKFLGQCLRFDDRNTRQARRESDKFAPIRNIWEKFVDNSKLFYTPSEYCTVDEQLLGFRGRCPFRVYMRSKPDKYGIKIIMMNDAKTYYMVNATPYVGKFIPPNNEQVPSYHVRTLSEPIHNTNRNLTVDNWFSSVPLFRTMLHEYKLTMVGTLRSNKPELPPSFIAKKPEGTSLFAFDSDNMLVSHSPKKNKNVLLLSTMHRTKEIDEETNKPSVILFYNSTKGGTDSFDQLCHTYSVARVSNRWPLRVWYGILDQSAINAMIIYNCREENKKMKRRSFLQELALSMVKPFLQSRLEVATLRRSIRIMICDILGVPNQQDQRPAVGQPRQQRRCSFCPRNRDRKTKNVCTSCHRSMCDEHRATLCNECID